MKDFERFFIYIVAIVVAALLFWGLTTVVKKSFSAPKSPQKIDAGKALQEQRQRSQDTLDKQKRLMEDQRQRLKDMQRR